MLGHIYVRTAIWILFLLKVYVWIVTKFYNRLQLSSFLYLDLRWTVKADKLKFTLTSWYDTIKSLLQLLIDAPQLLVWMLCYDDRECWCIHTQVRDYGLQASNIILFISKNRLHWMGYIGFLFSNNIGKWFHHSLRWMRYDWIC